MALSNTEQSHLFSNLSVLTDIFLVFAWILWPFFIPLFMVKLERDAIRKKYLKGFLFIGGIVSIVLADLLFSSDIYPAIVKNHIVFEKEPAPLFIHILGYFYFISLIFPFFISSTKNMKILGLVNFLGFLFARLAYTNYLISVWCFFAAISSVYILFMIHEFNGLKFQIPGLGIKLPFPD